MIKGIGVDIVDMKRIHVSEKLINRILTEKEKQYFYTLNTDERKTEYLAGRFAGKEAYVKALGTGFGDIGFQDIEILNDEKGKPYLNVPNSHISLSHDGGFAISYVIIEE